MSNGITPEQMLLEMHDKVNLIWAAFCGVPGTSDKGLMGEFDEHRKRGNAFRSEYYVFRRQCIAVFFFLLGSGVLGVGVWQVPILAGG